MRSQRTSGDCSTSGPGPPEAPCFYPVLMSTELFEHYLRDGPRRDPSRR